MSAAVLAVLVGSLLALSACATVIRNHGWVPTEDELAGILTGVDTRETVTEALGEPSTLGVLDDGSSQFYVRTSFAYRGWNEPEVVAREIVAVEFGEEGFVENISRFRLEDGRAIMLETRVTETSVAENLFVRQLLGGIGRVSAPAPTTRP